MTAPKSLFAEPSRFLSISQCEALWKRVVAFTAAGSQIQLSLRGASAGNLRWALNHPTTSGDTSDTELRIGVFDLGGLAYTNRIDDDSLKAAVSEMERLASQAMSLKTTSAPRIPKALSAGALRATRIAEAANHTDSRTAVDASKAVSTAPPLMPMGAKTHRLLGPQTYLSPTIWSETSFGLDAAARSEVARQMVAPIEAARFRSSGYIEVEAAGVGEMQTGGLFAYAPYTAAQYSLTVRTADGSGSGWAGVSDYDWSRIDSSEISHRALEKCRASVNPSALEPGRYTLIMEPQAVADMVRLIGQSLGLLGAIAGGSVFSDPKAKDHTKIGQKVLDERITLSEDPMDPDGGFVPFASGGDPYRKQIWIEKGVLKKLSYSRFEAAMRFNEPYAQLASGSLRMSGGDTSIDEMVATTKRGLLVTRFHGTSTLDWNSLLCTGVTRDGLWLIENGKIKQPIKNFRFNESPMFIFNAIEQMGRPVRTFRPDPSRLLPLIVPPVKVRDFSFTSLSDAV